MDELEGLRLVEPGVWELAGLGIFIRLKPLSSYLQNEDNPVKHSPRNFGTVLQSIQKLGALRSGFSSNGRILGGNLTYEAMAEAGLEWVIEVESNGQVWLMHERPDLNESQQKLAAYADQQSAFQAVWDVVQIASDVDEGFDATGVFSGDELGRYLKQAKQSEMLFGDRTAVIADLQWTAEDVQAVDDELTSRFAAERPTVEVVCPCCQRRFYVGPDALSAD